MPSPTPAVLPLTVLLVMLIVPASFARPPPKGNVAPLLVELPLKVLLVMLTVPDSEALVRPPPPTQDASQTIPAGRMKLLTLSLKVLLVMVTDPANRPVVEAAADASRVVAEDAIGDAHRPVLVFEAATLTLIID